MKLQYTQFLLLLFISLSEELSRLGVKDIRHSKRRIRKRQNYEIVDDNEPLAQIDVSSFIRSSDESSMNEQTPYVMGKSPQAINDFVIDNAAINDYEPEKADQDYQYLNSDLTASNRYKDRKIYPRFIDASTLSDSNREHFKPQYNNFDKMKNDWPPHDVGYNLHKEKKYALKKMKFPFFSHKKTTKSKKNKKRKFRFRNSKKQTSSVAKVGESHLNSNPTTTTSSIGATRFKIKKRSFFDRLCPSCKQKVLNANLVEDKLRSTMYNVIHNSRQYFQKTTNPKFI